jgi:hypothetical protein
MSDDAQKVVVLIIALVVIASCLAGTNKTDSRGPSGPSVPTGPFGRDPSDSSESDYKDWLDLGNERTGVEAECAQYPERCPTPDTSLIYENRPEMRAGCDKKSYPTVCIPPSPPDLDCGDIPYRHFKVLPPDPHRFDGDHDGFGCD